MNYGKIAYLKTLDLEQRLASVNFDSDNGFVCSEYSYDTYNEKFTDMHEIDYDNLKVVSSNICLQSKVRIEAKTEEVISVSVIVDDNQIGGFDQKLKVGENDIIIYKTYTGEENTEVDLKIVITGSATNEKIIQSVNTVFFGVASGNTNEEIEMRAVQTSTGVVVSYIVGNKLFVGRSENGEIEFNMHAEALSHSIIKRESDLEEKLQIFFVNNENKLYFCDFDMKNAIFIDDNVSRVFAKTMPVGGDDEVVVCYIKNGKPMYKTLTGSVFTIAREMPFPSGKYIDIRLVDSSDNFVYAIATNVANANFVIKSVLEISTGKFTESVSVAASMLVYKYYHLPFLQEKTVESVCISASVEALPYLSFSALGNKPFVENVRISCGIDAYTKEVEAEEIDLPVTYGVSIDLSNSNSEAAVTYIADSVGFERAYMDFENDVFVDNGWKDRWPFNKIKPCLMSKTGDIIGYLDKDDYSKFEDGSSADIYTVGSNDVMIEIPRIDYSFETVGTNIEVKISNILDNGMCSRAHTYKGKVYDTIYVAAYHSRWLETGDDAYPYEPYSVSGTPDRKSYLGLSSSIPLETIFACTRNRRENMEHYPLNVHILFEALYLIMFKHLDSQKALGYGVLPTDELLVTGGSLDKKGMYYGKSTSSPIKLFGIEDLYGNGSIYMPGFYIDGSRNVYVHNPMGTTDYAYTNQTTGMDLLYTTATNISHAYPTSFMGKNELGIVPTRSGGSADTYFNDNMMYRVIQRSFRLKGKYSDADVGMFSFYAGSNDTATDNVSRMVYYKGAN